MLVLPIEVEPAAKVDGVPEIVVGVETNEKFQLEFYNVIVVVVCSLTLLRSTCASKRASEAAHCATFKLQLRSLIQLTSVQFRRGG